MTEIVVLPHAELCPEGKTFEAAPGVSICDNLLEHGIDDRARLREVLRLHHLPRDRARRLRLAAAVVRGRGRPARPRVGPDAASRLSCQAIVGDTKLVIEIPKYTINHAKEATK